MGVRVRLLIVDDHAMLATALSRTLDAYDDIRVVAVCATAEQAISTLATTAIDVALVDLRLGDDDGVELVRSIRENWPGVHVVVLTAASDPATVRRAIDTGVDGYLLKGQPIDELVTAIADVAHGSSVIAPEAADALAQHHDTPALSTRQLELLQLMASGASTAELASALFISEHTVRNHIKHVLQRLGAHSRGEAVAIALRHRLVDVEPPQ